MEILDYDSFLKRILELKMQGKRVSELLTSGLLHKGHIEGIKLCRNESDVVTVVFCDYLQKLAAQIGLTNGNYILERVADLLLLKDLGIVDLVTSRTYDSSMTEDLFKMREIVVKEIPNLVSNEYLPAFFDKSKETQEAIISEIALGLRINPEERICDVEYWGDNNYYFKHSLLIGRKYNFYMPYKFFPIVRDEFGLPLQSRGLTERSKENQERKLKVSKIFKELLNQVIETGGIIKTPYDFLVEIINENSLKASNRLTSGENFFIKLGHIEDGYLFRDIQRISA